MSNIQSPNVKNKLSFSLDYKVIVFVLLAIIAAMLVMWKPWSATAANDRTIEVSGEAKILAEPDEFVFYPAYEVLNADKQAAINELSQKSSGIVNKLKSLGVSDNKIKTDTSGYENFYYGAPDKPQLPTYTLRLTVTVSTRDTSQKVQDYLVTTSPSGAVSPQPSFSETKAKELESKARDQATKEARTKADQTARNLGFRVGRVKSVQDGNGFGQITPMRSSAAQDIAGSSAGLAVQPGENEIRYTMTVVYYIK